MVPSGFQKAILDWFDEHGRTNLPWQQDITPYRVWVSEIMLQQTQVSTVIPYYLRFMDSFPTVQTLAEATTDDVLHHWTGLGYYARARNLHKSAQRVSCELNGEFPSSVEDLCELPGIGRSTAGAISAIAFKHQASILDGNVKRVLARFSAIEGWPGKAEVLSNLWAVAENYTPKHRIADYTQAIMDLGATVCTRSSPNCIECPLSSNCQAYHQGNMLKYPGKKPKKTIPVRTCCFLMIKNKAGELMLEQNPPSGLWGGLWVLPQCENIDQITEACHTLGVSPAEQTPMPIKRHTFSHFHLDYQPVEITISTSVHNVLKVAEGRNQLWYNLKNPLSLGMPAPIKALLDSAANKEH